MSKRARHHAELLAGIANHSLNGKGPIAAPVLWGVRDVMSALNIGRTQVWQLDRDGLLGPKIYIGVAPKWRVSAIMAFAATGTAA